MLVGSFPSLREVGTKPSCVNLVKYIMGMKKALLLIWTRMHAKPLKGPRVEVNDEKRENESKATNEE